MGDESGPFGTSMTADASNPPPFSPEQLLWIDQMIANRTTRQTEPSATTEREGDRQQDPTGGTVASASGKLT